MYDLFASVLRFIRVSEVRSDNLIFALHYKATMFILVVFSLLITQKQYFGDPIDCISNPKLDIMDTYCWISSTFTIKATGDETPHSGLGNHIIGRNGETKELRYHTYYQWVTLFLYMQALMFYIPRYLWKIWEGGRLKLLIDGMHLPIFDEEKLKEKKATLVTFFRFNMGKQRLYAFEFFICEILNLVNVIAQILITDAFIGYEFASYGLKALPGLDNSILNNLSLSLYDVFPIVSKCLFSRVGPSGTPEIYDAICVLPLNIMIQKIFIFLWFWYWIVVAASLVSISFRSMTFVPAIRRKILLFKAKIARPSDVNAVADKADIGDWFLLVQLAKNIDEITFRDFMTDLAIDLKK